MMSAKTVLIQKKDTICTLVLNRPEVMNAMNEALIIELPTGEQIKVAVLHQRQPGQDRRECAGRYSSCAGGVAG